MLYTRTSLCLVLTTCCPILLLLSPCVAQPGDKALDYSALAEQGDYEQALDLLEARRLHAPHDKQLALEAAALLNTLGRYSEALDLLTDAIDRHGPSPQLIVATGELLETLGRYDDAAQTYARIVELVPLADDADGDELLSSGVALERHATFSRRRASDQSKHILHNYLQKSYLYQPDYWHGHVQTGMFLLDKGRPMQALTEFRLARKINPNAPEIHVGLGMIALERGQFEQAIAHAQDALKTNPRHDGALLLQARCMMTWRRFGDAIERVEKMLSVNPHHIEALSLLSAAHLCMNDAHKARQAMERIASTNPTSWRAHLIIGEWLSAVRDFDQARKHLMLARELAPWSHRPLKQLGVLYMQTGEEHLAAEAFEKSHQLDDFGADVVNYLRLLEDMSEFVTKESTNFIVKVGDPDKVLLDQVSEYLEDIYDEMVAHHGHRPGHKIIVEIFPTQAQFSVRISGHGWVSTVGACTGRVIALAAPSPHRKDGPESAFNWAVVLRHELSHAITLSATDNRIPHWLTEAFAVDQQPDIRSYANIRVLVDSVRLNRLMPVSGLDWGFIRPSAPWQRHLAYAQSQWMLEYLIKQHGKAKILKMLDAFKRGLDQREVFEQVFEQTEKEFDNSFEQWARRQVDLWGFDASAPARPEETARALARDTNNPDLIARHAAALHYAGMDDDAMRSARQALKIDPANNQALFVKASLSVKSRKYDLAMSAADKAINANTQQAWPYKIMARCHLEQSDNARPDIQRAIHALTQYQRLAPHDDYSYRQLSDIYEKLGSMDAHVLPQLQYLLRHDLTNPRHATRLAEIHRRNRDYAESVEMYQASLHVNPYDSATYEAIAGLFVVLGQWDNAISAARNAVVLEGESARAFAKLSAVRYRCAIASNDVDMMLLAREDALRAVEIGNDPQARGLLGMIEQSLASVNRQAN